MDELQDLDLEEAAALAPRGNQPGGENPPAGGPAKRARDRKTKANSKKVFQIITKLSTINT